MNDLRKRKQRRLVSALAVGLVIAAVAGSPAQAVPDEGGGAAPSTGAPRVEAGGFDWSDAGVGIGIGAAAGAVAVGAALATRRHRIAPHEVAHPAAR